MADDAGALLVRAGLITAEHLAAARASREQDGGTLGEHLVVSGMVSDEKLTEFYRTRLLVPQVHPNTLARLSPSIIGLLPADLAAELRAVPVALDKDDNLTVAMSDPSDRHAVDEIGFFTGKYVVRAVATQMQIAWCLAQYYDCLTELGEQLLQPVASGAPAPAPAPAAPPAPAPDTVKPLVPHRGDTGRIEASRHKVLAPVTNPPPMAAVRPTAVVFDRGSPTPAPFTPVAAPAATLAAATTPAAPAASAASAPSAPATPVQVEAAPASALAEAVAAASAVPRPHALLPTSMPAIHVPPADEPAPAATPLPRGAFGGTTAETEPPPPASLWQRPTEQTPAVEPAPDVAALAPPPASTGETSGTTDRAPEPASDDFDDTPSIIISADFARPTRQRVVLPDPPELAARTGEMEIIDLANKIFEAPTTSIEINFGPEPEAAPAEPAASASAAAAFEATTVVGPAPAPTLQPASAVPASAPSADTAPMGSVIPPPPRAAQAEAFGPDSVVTSVGGRALSEPMIEVIAAEASSRAAIPVATSADADTRRLDDADRSAVERLSPPEMPASDGTPEAIAEAGADDGAGADGDYETVPLGEGEDEGEVADAALLHAKRPEAVVEDEIEDGTVSAPILLDMPRRSGSMSAQLPVAAALAAEAPRPQAIVVEAIDDASGPVLLTDRMRRREARRREKGTMVGIGHLGPIPRSAEPTPSPYALPPHAAPEAGVAPVDAPGADAPPEAAADDAAAPAVPSHVPEAFSEGVATVRRSLVSFEEHDDLDDGWGAPGTTIPPGFIGAVPAEVHDRPSEPAPALAAAPAASAVPAPMPESKTRPRVAPVDRRQDRPAVVLPAIPPPRVTPPGARPAATLTPLNRNRAVAGVPDPTHLADLLERASQRLVELLHGLDSAMHRDHVIAMLVDFVGESHHRVAFLALRNDELVPFMQIPEPTGPAPHLDLRGADTFQDVIGTRLPYRGPISDPSSRDLVKALFGSATDEMLLVPVAVRDRVVGVLYGDGRHRHSFDEHVTVAGRAAGLALQRILKEKKQ